jgi:hypothetical protein
MNRRELWTTIKSEAPEMAEGLINMAEVFGKMTIHHCDIGSKRHYNDDIFQPKTLSKLDQIRQLRK